jgi:hypothetical protein
MELNVESIKALERGKVYVLEIDNHVFHDNPDVVNNVAELFHQHDITVFVFGKGFAKFVEVPEGMMPVKEKEENF